MKLSMKATYQMKHIKHFLIFVSVLLLVACNSATPEQGGEATTAGEDVSPTATAAVTPLEEGWQAEPFTSPMAAPTVKSFRLSYMELSQAEPMVGEGIYTNQPRAQRVRFWPECDPNNEAPPICGRTNQIEEILIEEVGYRRNHDNVEWQPLTTEVLQSRSAESHPLRLQEGEDRFAVLAEHLDLLEGVAREEPVNGRVTIHLRGGKEFLAAVGEPWVGEEIDLWYDEQEKFLVRVEVRGPEGGERYDFHDFNAADLQVTAPPESSDAQALLKDLLGFDLALPADTELMVTPPIGLMGRTSTNSEEVVASIRASLEANGYQVEEAPTPAAGDAPIAASEGYSVQNEERNLLFLLMPAPDGKTTFILAHNPRE